MMEPIPEWRLLNQILREGMYQLEVENALLHQENATLRNMLNSVVRKPELRPRDWLAPKQN